MKNLYILFFLLSTSVFAQDSKNNTLELPTPSQASDDSSLKQLVWNKWETENFIILSLDKNQGIYLKNNIEKIKSSLSGGLGLEDTPFPVKCKILCVPDKEFMSKLFRISDGHNEVRKNVSGNVSLCAIWIDNENIENLKFHISSICLKQGVSKNNNSIMIQKGVSFLNRSVDDIKDDIKTLEKIDLKFLLDATEEKWNSFSDDQKENYIKSSELICLLLRKEFGRDKFALFLNSQQKEKDLLSIFGFESSGFEKTIDRYLKNLKNDIDANKTPDKYLKIN